MNFLLTQYVLRADRISVGKESACKAGNPVLIPGSGRSLEEEMATHSSILVWRIPWTEEPGRLQSRGSQELDTTEHARMRGKSN